VLEKRKNKFLSMGRSAGLSSAGKSHDKLSLQTNFLIKFIQKLRIDKKKNLIIIFILLLLILLGVLI